MFVNNYFIFSKGISIVGDTHGDHTVIYELNSCTSRTCILHVGDIFMGTTGNDDNILTDLNGKLKMRNNILMVVRGNHDRPSMFKGMHRTADNRLLTNVVFIPDYSVIVLPEKNRVFMCAGGAVSMGRNKGGGHWYRNEHFKYDEEKIKHGAYNYGITDVITHTAPNIAYPSVPIHTPKSPNISADINQERKLLTDMYRIVQRRGHLTNWFYGHFHTDHTARNDDNVNFRAMGFRSISMVC